MMHQKLLTKQIFTSQV